MDATSYRGTPSPSAAPTAVPLPSSPGSSAPLVRIRAPPTADSDFSSSGSDYSVFGSEGFVSGEEYEFESASDRAYVVSTASVDDEDDEISTRFVADPDEEVVVQSSRVVDEYVFPRTSVENPSGRGLQRISSLGANVVSTSGPSVTGRYRQDVVSDSSDVEEGPFARNPGRRSIAESTTRNFVDRARGKTSIGLGVSSLPKLSMPVALLSGVSDDGSVGSEVEDGLFPGTVGNEVEDGLFPGKARIPDAGENVIIISNVTDSGDDEVEGNELQFEDSIWVEDLSGVSVTDGTKATMPDDTGLDSFSTELVEGLVALDDHLVASRDDMSPEDLVPDEESKHSCEEVQVSDLDKGEEHDYQFSSSILREPVNEVVGFGERNCSVEEGTVNDFVRADLVEDMGLINFDISGQADCVVANIDSTSPGDSELDEQVNHFEKAVQEFEGAEREVPFIGRNTMEGESAYLVDDNASLTTEIVELDSQEMGVQIVEDDTRIKFGALLVDDDNCEKHDAHVFNRETEEEILQSDQGVANDDKDRPKQAEVEFEQGFQPGSLSNEAGSRNTSHGQDVHEEEEKMSEKLQMLQGKFLRLVQKLGISTKDSVPTEVLSRLALASRGPASHSSSLELEIQDELNFSLTILVIGKTGVGKSSTINSFYGEMKALTNAFHPATTTVKEIVGSIDGVTVRIVDTPGFRSSLSDQPYNKKILSSIKKFMKKCPPDVVLYVDRMDTHAKDLHDLPLLKLITSSLGPSLWRNSIITLTHSSSVPPDGPTGSPLSYHEYVSQRWQFFQQLISLGSGGKHKPNAVSLVENHQSCRINGNGQNVLPDGICWKPQLLLLCYSVKILCLATPLDRSDNLLPLHRLLSSLLQPFAYPSFAQSLDLDQEDEDEDGYDQLPPFIPLSKSDISELSKARAKDYFEEYDYHVKLLQKKQWREDMIRLKEKIEGKVVAKDWGDKYENCVYVDILPNLEVPPPFDGDNPSYRYRFHEPPLPRLTRPVLKTHGWDHDLGYDGATLDLGYDVAIANRFPAVFSAQITMDKEKVNIHMDSSVSAKLGENGLAMAGVDIRTIGEQRAYVLKGGTRIKNLKGNKTAAGVSVIYVGENAVPGFKLEDEVAVGKNLYMVGSTGCVQYEGDNAYGFNLEMHLREKDVMPRQDKTTLGFSLIRWKGDLALTGNLKSRFSLGRKSKMNLSASLIKGQKGQISIKMNSQDQHQIDVLGLLLIVSTISRIITA